MTLADPHSQTVTTRQGQGPDAGQRGSPETRRLPSQRKRGALQSQLPSLPPRTPWSSSLRISTSFFAAGLNAAFHHVQGPQIENVSAPVSPKNESPLTFWGRSPGCMEKGGLGGLLNSHLCSPLRLPVTHARPGTSRHRAFRNPGTPPPAGSTCPSTPAPHQNTHVFTSFRCHSLILLENIVEI